MLLRLVEAVEEEQEAVGAFGAAGMKASAATEGERLRRNQNPCDAARDKSATGVCAGILLVIFAGVQRSHELAAVGLNATL